MIGRRETPELLDEAIDELLREDGRPRLVDAPEGELAAMARLVRDSLPRFHPGLRFTETLADRLREASSPGPAGRSGRAAPAPGPRPAAELIPFEVHALERQDLTATGRRRALLAGGAIASGVSLALPLAGAALLRWRRSRSSGGFV